MRLALNVGTSALIVGEVDSYESPDQVLAAAIADPSLIVTVFERGLRGAPVFVRGSAIRAVVAK